MKEMTAVATKILSEAGWTETGQQIPAGLAQGVAMSKSTFLDELTNMALAGVEAVKSTLEINSPSRVFGSWVTSRPRLCEWPCGLCGEILCRRR